MVRRHALALLISGCVAALVLVSVFLPAEDDVGRQTGEMESAANEDTGRPNIILVIPDAFRADRMGAERNGVPITPALTDLAERSLYFPNAVTPCTWTRPAVASLFTGLYVDTHQVLYDAKGTPDDDKLRASVLPANLETIASYMKRAGYSTAGVQTNGNLIKKFGFAQGFDKYFFNNGGEAAWVIEHAKSLLTQLERPFFLYLHFMEPHAHYDPPEEYVDMFGGLPPLDDADRRATAHTMDYVIDYVWYTLGARDVQGFEPVSENGREAFQVLYDGECRYMDDQLAWLFEYVKSELRDTILIVVADHGEEFWEHDLMGHGLTMYEEVLRAPLIIHGPGITVRRVDAPVNTVDLLPTLAGLLESPPEPGTEWQGRDLLEANSIEEKQHLFSATYSLLNNKLERHVEMVLEPPFKLILDRETRDMELYDLSTDPGETHNLVDTYPQRSMRLRAVLDEHRKENLRHLRKLQRGGPPVDNTVEIDEETREQLRDLGYLE